MCGPWRTHMRGPWSTQAEANAWAAADTNWTFFKKNKSISVSVLRRMSLLRAILADDSSVRKWPTQKFGS